MRQTNQVLGTEGGCYDITINRVNKLDSQNRERVASKVHRQETLDGLKKFNARRKLKVSVPDKYN